MTIRWYLIGIALLFFCLPRTLQTWAYTVTDEELSTPDTIWPLIHDSDAQEWNNLRHHEAATLDNDWSDEDEDDKEEDSILYNSEDDKNYDPYSEIENSEFVIRKPNYIEHSDNWITGENEHFEKEKNNLKEKIIHALYQWRNHFLPRVDEHKDPWHYSVGYSTDVRLTAELKRNHKNTLTIPVNIRIKRPDVLGLGNSDFIAATMDSVAREGHFRRTGSSKSRQRTKPRQRDPILVHGGQNNLDVLTGNGGRMSMSTGVNMNELNQMMKSVLERGRR